MADIGTGLTRRAILKSAAGAAVASAGGSLLVGCAEPIDTSGQVTFDNALAIPPIAEPRLDGQGRKVFSLAAQRGTKEFLAGKATATLGFNGDYLGPTLRAERGDEVAVEVRNDLDEVTSVHWHGMHLPAASDGGPHQPIEAGGDWAPRWYVNQPAATLWYHPHPHGQTEKHVYRGLAGLFIIDDDDESALALPRQYGTDDIPVIVQDRLFHDDGSFNEDDRSEAGLLGDTILVNGTRGPYLDVTTERVRLRILNASTARTYDFGFTDQRGFQIIGTDGGLLAEPHPADRILMSPGERVEIVVTFKAAETAVLRSFPPDPTGEAFGDSGGDADTLDILEFRAAAELVESPAIPQNLVEIPRLDPQDAVATRSFALKGRKINGQKMEMSRVDEVVTVDSTEVWKVSNEHGQYHNFHVHDVQFQVLDVDGRQPRPELMGWKDTVFLPRRSSKTLIMRFADYSDPAVPYMYHCHLLRHEDEGMMGQFVVVEPGQQPDLADGGHDHD